MSHCLGVTDPVPPQTKADIKAKLQIVYRHAADLKLDLKNPRVHSERQIRQIAESVRAFGFNVPVVIDSKYRVIAGHGRLLACPLVGIKEVPTIMLEKLTEAQARAFMISDNRLTENATWNRRLLAEQFKALAEVELDFSLEVTGFDMPEIDLMIEDLSPAIEGEQDLADELPQPTTNVQVSSAGDLWQLGRNRVLCANPTQAANYADLMAGQKAAAIFTQFPHSITDHFSACGETQRSNSSMACTEVAESEFTAPLTNSLTCLADHCLDGSIAYLSIDWQHMFEMLTAGRRANLQLKNLCIWDKGEGTKGWFYSSQHELVFVFKIGKGCLRNNIQQGKFGRHRSNLWHYSATDPLSPTTDEDNLRTILTTVKPVAMVADAIMDCSGRNDIILDGFLGSGSTVIAAERTGRICYGLEPDPARVDTIIRRWQAFTGKTAIHLRCGRAFNEIEEEKSNGR